MEGHVFLPALLLQHHDHHYISAFISSPWSIPMPPKVIRARFSTMVNSFATVSHRISSAIEET